MNFSSRVLAGVVLLLGVGVAQAADEDARVAAWVAVFQRYAARPDLQIERQYAMQASKPGVPTLRGLLRTLPAPTEWPRLRAALAAAKAPPGPPQQRLQAGVWLLDYLQGNRAAVLADLPLPNPESPTGHAVQNLRGILGKPADEARMTPEQVLGQFETELSSHEPVSVEEVERAMDGKENFQRLQRLLKGARDHQEKSMKVFEEFQDNKDEAAARTKMTALQEAYVKAYGADQQALESYLELPVVMRYAGSLHGSEDGSPGYVPSVRVPDLVKAGGPEKARALLLRALRLRVTLSVSEETGDATSRLARELALAEMATVKAPSWSLAHDVEASALFEAMVKRFPVLNPDESYEFKTARGYYLAGLIQGGRVQEAVEFAGKSDSDDDLDLPWRVMDALEKSPQAPELWRFLRSWLARHPASSEWSRFNRLSAQLGRQAELKAFIKSLAASGAFDGVNRLKVQQMQADAELAAGELDAAAARLLAAVQTAAGKPEEIKAQIESARKLMQLAGLRDDLAGFAQALATTEALVARLWPQKPSDALEATLETVTTLHDFDRYAEGSRLAQAALVRVPVLKKRAGSPEAEGFNLSDHVVRNLQAEALRAAVELGRWPEALALVEAGRWWQARDASDLLKETLCDGQKPVGYYLAQVALHEKQPDRARALLEMQLAVKPAVDAVYEAYVGLAGQDARPLLAKLAAADRYQERPLIWLARLQSDAGEWDAAIETLQQAINIDPSDGEQGRGDRMRVYAFMGRAVEAKGDAGKAKFFADVVKSIRLSETADRWFSLGSYTEAIARYRQALGFFQDAYCIQSRLAVRLAGEGRIDEAAEHYRKAFELMPDSFGRVESHCFGCEHVFAGEQSQGTAEKVFQQMLAARPDKPQLHYLMGYLRKEQERWPEAAAHFRRAVALDPLYLNAWDKLAGLGGRDDQSTPAQRDDLLLKLVELDPMRSHVSPDLEKVADLARLWTVLKQADAVVTALPAARPVWPLKASAAEMDQSDDARGLSFGPVKQDFATVLLEHDFLEAWQGYLANVNGTEAY